MYSTKEIASIVGGKLTGTGNRLSTNSRAVSLPEQTIFVAIKTHKGDGHLYIDSLYKNNVRSFIVSSSNNWAQQFPEADFIEVENTLQALQALAAHHRSRFNIPVVAVTGSNGKTIVKEWLFQLLHSRYNICRSPRSYNSQTGVPLSVWEMGKDNNMAIIEAGISQMNEMEKLQRIIRPTVGIFTTLGDAHQENFPSTKVKCCEKIKLFSSCDTVIYNKDDKLIDICMQQEGLKARFLTYGTSTNADIHIKNIDKKNGETEITYEFDKKEGKYSIPFIDNASIEDSLPCLAMLLLLKTERQEIAANMAALEKVAMRLEVKQGVNGCTVIDDSYNSDINSLDIALDFLKEQASATHTTRTLILSDIMQSGQQPSMLYQSVQSLIINKGVDKLIGIGPEMKKHEDLMDAKEKHFFASTEDFISRLGSLKFSGETILLKGSRPFHFEDISDLLSYAVHETALEVNLSALVANFNYFHSFLRPGTKMCCMVKAYAYGSGDIEVSRALQQCGCDYLAVAVADEGAALRRQGIHIPIMVMDPAPNAFPKIFENNLEPEIYNFAMLDRVTAEAKRMNVTDYPVHIKIDSGMHRLGFLPEEIDEVISRLKGQNQVRPRSVFSHFVGSDDAQFDAFTAEQVRRFNTARDKLTAAFDFKIMAHICNSAGIERFSQHQNDMVRLGIGLYGISAIDNSRLQQVCTLKTNILQIKHVPQSETVGYSRNGKLQHDSVIGAIPIGYADGLDRHLGNRHGSVYVNGHFAPIVGNICMDVCMIDLTGINAQEGDAVEIFGPHLPITQVANLLGTIPYEILTSVSRRVKRIYYKE